jgi:hypothetical protein
MKEIEIMATIERLKDLKLKKMRVAKDEIEKAIWNDGEMESFLGEMIAVSMIAMIDATIEDMAVEEAMSMGEMIAETTEMEEMEEDLEIMAVKSQGRVVQDLSMISLFLTKFMMVL